MTHNRMGKQWPLSPDHKMLAALIALPFLWYFQEIFTDTCLFADDLNAQYRPWWNYARDRLLQGEFPLWNPYVFCGMPYHINPENFMFYPLKIPLTLLPYFKGAILLRVLNCIIASTGIFYFLRHYRVGTLAAGAGAIMFSYGSFMSYEFIHMPYINVVCWLPWELLTLKMLFDRPCLRRACALSAVTAASFLGGSPGVFAITQFMTGLIAMFMLIKPLFQHKWTLIKNIILFVLVSILFFTALTAILLLPVLQFIQFSPRSGGLQQLDTFINFSIDPSLMNLLILPFMHWINGAPYPPIYPMLVVFIPYAGIAGFGLAILGLFSRRGLELRPALFVCFISGIMLALGKNTAFFPFLFHRIELIRWFRWPHDYLLLTYTSLCVLTAFGLDIIFRGSFIRRHVAVAIAAIIFIAFDLYVFGLGYRITGSKRDLDMAHLKPGIDFIKNNAGFERVSVSSSHGNYHFHGQQYFFRSFPSLSSNPKWMKSELPELNTWAAGHAAAPWYSFYLYRAQLFDNWALGSISYPINNAMRFGYQELCGYNPFMLERVNAILRVQSIENVWDLCNVRFIATPVELSETGWHPVFANQHIQIYETPSRVPRAFIPLRVNDHLKENEIYRQMQKESFDPTELSYVEEPLAKPIAPLSAEDIIETPVIRSYSPERVAVTADIRTNALLVLNDACYPGWKVYIDGVEHPVLRANYAFRAVRLPPGKHKIEWVYSPTLFFMSAALSIIAWMFVLCAGAFRLLHRKGVSFVRQKHDTSQWISGTALEHFHGTNHRRSDYCLRAK